MANPLDEVTEDQRERRGENPLKRVYIFGDQSTPEGDPGGAIQPHNNLTQAVAPEQGGVAQILARVAEYLTNPTGFSEGTRAGNALFGTGEGERFQTWPERMLRSGFSLPGDVATGKVPVTDPETGRTAETVIERAMDTGGLMGGGALTVQKPGSATLGSGPIKPPKVLYRGVVEGAQDSGAKGLGTSHLGKGLYSSSDKSFAKKYASKGEILEFSPEDAFPSNPLVLNGAGGAGNLLMDHVFKNSNFKNAREFNKAYPDVGDWVREQGYDGVVVNKGEEIVKYPRSLFSDTQKPGAAVSGAASSTPAPVFYSALEHAVTNVAQDAMSPQQWLGPRTERKYIDNNKQSKTYGQELTEVKYGGTLGNMPGVTPEEIAWTGLPEWLAAQKGKVRKEDVQAYLDEHKVEIKDVTKNSDTGFDHIAVERVDDGYNLVDNKQNAHIDHFKTREEAERARTELINDPDLLAEHGYDGGDTKYSSYQLPGGENYREHLLTLPQKELDIPWSREKGDRLRELTRKSEQNTLTSPELDELIKLNGEARSRDTAPAPYKSSHWDEPNVLAHVRTNDRVIDGKKSLHVEEIQSDWHQQGRKQGYKEEVPKQQIEKSRDDLSAIRVDLGAYIQDKIHEQGLRNDGASKFLQLIENDKAGEVPSWLATPEFAHLSKEYKKAFDDHGALTRKMQGVPDAPFKTSWPELAFKRMIRQAAEEGYDRISWTPGEAQAARYDLSRKLAALQYNRNQDGTYNLMGGTYEMKPWHFGDNIPADKLPDYVGKGIAQKIVDDKSDVGVLKGLDLKVGGEGMREFYDKMLPKMVEKIGKAHGVKVQKGTATQSYDAVDPKGNVVASAPTKGEMEAWVKRMNDANKNLGVGEFKLKEVGQPIFYFDLPPSLREQAIGKGFPLYLSGIPFPLTPVDYDPFKEGAK